VAPYDILSPQEAPVAGETTTIPLTFQGAAGAVFDYGAGFEQQVDEKLRFYAGAAHNGSNWVPGAETFASWDLTHLTVGLSLRAPSRRAHLAFGVAYAWGKGALPPLVSSPFAAAPQPTPQARFWQLSASVGATFHAEE